MQNNSVLIASGGVTGVIVFVKALINFIRAMRWFALDDEQWSALSVFLETVIPIVAVWVAAWYVSRNTTNINDPRDVDGEPLSRKDDKLPLMKMEGLQTEALQINAEVDKTRGF